MKKFLKRLFFALCNLFYHPRLAAWYHRLKCQIHWSRCAANICSIGDNPEVSLGAQVIGGPYIRIGNNFRAGQALKLQAWDHYAGQSYTPSLTIGDDVVLTDYIQISCAHSVTIGNHVLMGQNAFISDNGHGGTDYETLCQPPLSRELSIKGPVVIEDNVWIGRNVTILSGVTIGKGAVIAANSVVNKDVPPYAVAGGVPAKVIKHSASAEVIRQFTNSDHS